MKEFFNRSWSPITGAFSSISWKGVNDFVVQNSQITDAADEITKQAMNQPNHPLITYFWIGMLGGLGGLFIKIAWGCIKRIFPRIKNIDK